MGEYAEYLGDMYSEKTFERKLEYLRYNFGHYLKKDMRVLELGPGLGEFISFLKEKSITDVDVIDRDESVLKHLQQNFDLSNTWLAEVEELPSIQSELGEYDCIIMLQIMEHIKTEALPVMLGTLFKCLKPGGVLIITVPNSANPLSIVERYSDITHYNLFCENSLRQLVKMSDAASGSVSVVGYRIPPTNLVNLVRRALQKLLHLALKGLLMVNGGVYFHVYEPNITLVVKKER